jgi:hypothetical protein
MVWASAVVAVIQGALDVATGAVGMVSELSAVTQNQPRRVE